MSGLTEKQRALLAGRGDSALNAYYYSFDPTGCEPVDLILAAVAWAGKAAHHTQDWYDSEPHWESYGGTPAAFIQAAAESAAAAFGAQS